MTRKSKKIDLDSLVNLLDALKSITVPVQHRPGKVTCKIASVDFNGDIVYSPLEGGAQRAGDVNSKRRGVSSAVSKATGQIDSSDQLASTKITPPVDQTVSANFFDYNSYHARCIKLIAMCSAGLGWMIKPYDENAKPGKDSLAGPEYDKLKNFCDTPNEDQELLSDILTNWSVERQVYGHGYLEIVNNGKGELAEIYNLRALNTYIRKYYNNFVLTQEVLGKLVNFDFLKPGAKPKQNNEVLALKEYSLKSKYYGSPPWYSATSSISLSRSIDEFHIRSFKNNMMIEFAIIVEGGELDSAGLASVTEFLRKNFRGIENAGKSLYLNSDTPEVKIRIEKLNREVRDASFVNLMQANRESVVIAHGIPIKVLGIQTAGQLGGGEGEVHFQIFNETIVRPERERIKKKINFLFKERLGITKFYLELRELNIEDFLQLAQSASLLRGILDDNEIRTDLLGYEPREETPLLLSKRLDKWIREGNELKKKLFENS
jgi:PBSX family phage portal protein